MQIWDYVLMSTSSLPCLSIDEVPGVGVKSYSTVRYTVLWSTKKPRVFSAESCTRLDWMYAKMVRLSLHCILDRSLLDVIEFRLDPRRLKKVSEFMLMQDTLDRYDLHFDGGVMCILESML